MCQFLLSRGGWVGGWGSNLELLVAGLSRLLGASDDTCVRVLLRHTSAPGLHDVH